ncbi:MAG TPA: DUF1844 domain-containing protein [Syntrophorhabdaceae bacterium]|nr:DUF1844 domain-containing protein [Syntrophorhabdaceae bacterium]HQM82925.1 DUF1844 domain-containing protein [Syntrophorhabdaceae bacterium]
MGDEKKITNEEGFPELTFTTFLLSLSTSAIVSLGELPDPLKNEQCVNLSLAKQTINIIEILKEKTRGNLNEDEERLIEDILYDLRLKYVNAAKECKE